MKVWKMIWEMSKMPLSAEILLFTNYGEMIEDTKEVIGIRLLVPDPDACDLVEIQYKNA